METATQETPNTEAASAEATTETPAVDMIPQDKANAMVASVRKKYEAKNAEMASKMTELQEQLEELSEAKSGKPDVERQLEKLQAKLKAAQDEAGQYKTEAETTKRNMLLKDVSAQVGWHDGVSAMVRDAALAAITKDMDLSDLSDADVVKPLVDSFRESNPTLIAGNAPSGAGSKPGAPEAKGGVQEISQASLLELAKSDRSKYDETMKTVWAGAAEGKIKIVA